MQNVANSCPCSQIIYTIVCAHLSITPICGFSTNYCHNGRKHLEGTSMKTWFDRFVVEELNWPVHFLLTQLHCLISLMILWLNRQFSTAETVESLPRLLEVIIIVKVEAKSRKHCSLSTYACDGYLSTNIWLYDMCM